MRLLCTARQVEHFSWEIYWNSIHGSTTAAGGTLELPFSWPGHRDSVAAEDREGCGSASGLGGCHAIDNAIVLFGHTHVSIHLQGHHLVGDVKMRIPRETLATLPSEANHSRPRPTGRGPHLIARSQCLQIPSFSSTVRRGIC